MKKENVALGMGMGMGMSEMRSRGPRGCDQNRDELVRLVDHSREWWRSGTRTSAESKPVDGFAELFRSNGDLVNEVRATLRTSRLFVVRSARRNRSHELLGNVAPDRIARKHASELQRSNAQFEQPFSNIFSTHPPSSAAQASKLRIPIPIPMPSATLSEV